MESVANQSIVLAMSKVSMAFEHNITIVQLRRRFDELQQKVRS